ncbi:MAG: hypothetical protein ACOVS5_08385 [Oligoflexus sp.]|jgi:hypothetical protein
MNIQFPDKDPQAIISRLQEIMGDRELGKMVQFEMVGGEMVVKISKLGTSTLHFTCTPGDKGCHFSLAKEKIALAHKPLKGEVTSKIIKVIEKAGGVVQS